MLAHRALKAAELARFRALARGVASWSRFDPSQMTAENPAEPSNLGKLKLDIVKRRKRF